MSEPASKQTAAATSSQQGVLRRHGMLLAKIALSVLLLVAIGCSLDLNASAAVIRRIDLPTFIWTTLLLASSVAVIVPRWRAILRVFGHDLPLHRLLPSVYAGFVFNQVLPTAVGGDMLRIHSIVQCGVPLWRATSSVIVDRIMGIVGALILLLLGITFTAFLFDGGTVLPIALVAGGAAATGLAGLLIVGHVPPLRVLWADRLLHPLRTLSRDVSASLWDRKQGTIILALSVLTQMIPVGALYLIAQGSGLTLPFTSFLVLGPLTMLVAAIPLSFAGWGMREGAMMYLLSNYGVAASDALAVSVVFGGLMLVASLPGVAAILAPTRRS